MLLKAVFLAGGAVGYVLGTRAGREQFDKIQGAAQGLWQNPKVQSTVSGVQGKAGGLLNDKAPALTRKVGAVVRPVGGRSSGGEHVAEDTTDSLEAGGDLTADGYRPAGPTALS